MSILAKFEFEGNQVRIVTIESETWFVAEDIGSVLELETIEILSILSQDEKQELSCDTVVALRNNPDTVRLAAISEAGMYCLLAKSIKARSQVFKRWFVHEIKPTIRDRPIALKLK